MNRFIKDVKKYAHYASYAAKSELKAEVANSHLSWLWWILDPLFFMLVYTFISIIVFDTSEKYFPVFVFIGLTSWSYFEKTVKQSVRLVTNNRAIVSKVYLPKHILILIKMYSNGIRTLISFALVGVMMIIYRVPITLNILYIIPIFIILLLFTFGVSTFMLHFGVFVEDLSNIITIVLRLAFYMSGIFFSIENRIQDPIASLLLRGNPLALIMDDLRRCMIYAGAPHRKMLLVWFLVSCFLSWLGIRTIYKYENSYVKVI